MYTARLILGITVLALCAPRLLPAQNPPALPDRYDPAIFENRIPADELAALRSFAGLKSGDVARDKQFRKAMRSAIPDCMFHYGRDMPLDEALDTVFKGSPVPARIRDARYLELASRVGPYLAGRGFLWIDLQEGIALGAFYFHPTNGEPTPTLTVFSKQVKERILSMRELPPEFAADLNEWRRQSNILPLTTRYFITGLKKRILLEHDEDYCTPDYAKQVSTQSDCQQMNAAAADIDLNTAYYLQQVNYATNATAWMITGDDQIVWIRLRDRTCGAGPDVFGCRIRMTRERLHVVVGRAPMPRPPHR